MDQRTPNSPARGRIIRSSGWFIPSVSHHADGSSNGINRMCGRDGEAVTDYLFRDPRCTPESRAGRPPEPRTERLGGMLIERDVAVEVAPGEPIYIDVYRP